MVQSHHTDVAGRFFAKVPLKATIKEWGDFTVGSASALIVMTATIDPGRLDNLVLMDPQLRWNQYQESLGFWLSHPSVKDVVFFENSGCAVDFSYVQQMATRLGKRLEIVTYKGNQGTSERGRGYGEGELLNRALNQSYLIRQQESFFKVTGRFKVLNFAQLEASSRPHRVVVNARSLRKRQWADTRFFKMTPEFYREHLAHVHQESASIDYVLGEGYARALQGLKVPAFRVPIHVVGVAGNGNPYHDSALKLAIKSVFALAGSYRV